MQKKKTDRIKSCKYFPCTHQKNDLQAIENETYITLDSLSFSLLCDIPDAVDADERATRRTDAINCIHSLLKWIKELRKLMNQKRDSKCFTYSSIVAHRMACCNL